jgi:dephospho-CoA kinase
MRVVGLTGGIASGKSTVARMLRELGAEVIDADQVAREVVEPGHPAYHDVVKTFGREVLDANQQIDRKKLGAIVFADAEKRKELNAITHPRIADLTARKMATLAARGVPVAIYEASLLVENGVHKGLGGLIVVAASEENQIARVMKRDGLSEAEARSRLAAQLPLSEKVKAATWVIHADGTLDDTRAQVVSLWQELSK